MLLAGINRSRFIQRIWRGRMGQRWVENKCHRFLAHLQPTDRILDVGAGNCLIASHLAKLGYDTTAVDIVNQSIVPAITPVIYPGNELPFSAKSFDVVLLLTVLHHTQNPEAVLSEALRVGKRVIILEDVYAHEVQRIATLTMDTVVNLGASPMTYQNKSDRQWRALFGRMNTRLTYADSAQVLGVFKQALYVLE